MADAALVAAGLKQADPDRYYATLLLPEPQREAVQALYAFAADVASVRDRAQQPTAGEIRLQWWTDALRGEGHGAVSANPIAAALLAAVVRYDLPTMPLQRLVAARRFDLYDDPMPDVPTFEGYAGETASVLFQYAAMILNDGAPVEPGDAAGHLGVAQALLGHLRAFGLNASRGRVFLPLSVFAACGVRESEIFAGTDSEGLRAAHAQFSEMAGDHLAKARAAIAAGPAKLRPAFALLPVLDLQMRTVERANAAPLSPVPDVPDWRKIAAMALWGWRNRRG